jgi:hypothetical protein
MLTAPLVVATNQALTSPQVQAQVREMHAEGRPLLEMVDALGLSGNMTPEIRAVLQDLSPDVVASIRQATLDALDNGRTQMPLACGITDAELESGADVNVEVVQSAVGSTILVLPS